MAADLESPHTAKNGVKGDIVVGGKRFTRGEIARASGLHLSHISRIFSGKVRPSVLSVLAISKATGVSADTFLTAMERKIRNVPARDFPDNQNGSGSNSNGSVRNSHRNRRRTTTKRK